MPCEIWAKFQCILEKKKYKKKKKKKTVIVYEQSYFDLILYLET